MLIVARGKRGVAEARLARRDFGPSQQPCLWCGQTRTSFKPSASAKSRLLQLAIDAVRKLVEAFVDADLLRDHLLQRCGPLGRQVEEQRLRREVDLGTGSRDVVLLEVTGIGLRNPVAELTILPDRRTHRVDEI